MAPNNGDSDIAAMTTKKSCRLGEKKFAVY